MATPTVRNPTVHKGFLAMADRPWPSPVIGDQAAVPKIAASVVTAQFA